MVGLEIVKTIIFQDDAQGSGPTDNQGILWDGTTDTLLWDGTTDDVQWD